MSRISLIAPAILLAVFGARADDEAVKAELKKMEGTWQLTSAVADGKETLGEVVKKVRVVIKDGKHTVHLGDDVVVKDIPFKLDPSQKPKTTDDTVGEGKTIKGIYKLDGDTLTSCVAEVGKDRPTEFASKAGSGHTLRVFKRVKE